MKDVRVLVISPAPELASRVNAALRGAGLVVQVEWASDADDAAPMLEQPAHDLVFCELPQVDAATVVKLVAGAHPPPPVIGLADDIDTELLAGGLQAGLRDIVVSERGVHVAAVAKRELTALEAMRAMAAAHGHVAVARQERDALFAHSGDALARAEDGILVEANAAWAELFGDERAAAGVPVMDLFTAAARTPLRAALRKPQRGALDLVARGAGEVEVPVRVSIRELGDGGLLEIAIRSGAGQRTLAEQLERAQRLDAGTGLLNRGAFISEVERHADAALVLARIDDFARVVEKMGVLGSDAVAVQFAALLQSLLDGHGGAGRLEGTTFGVILPGADAAASQAWCERVREAIGAAVFEFDGRSTPLTAAFAIRAAGDDAGQRLDDAYAALRSARADGGNCVVLYERPKTEAEVKAEAAQVSDAEWVDRIKRALRHGHFRLAFQPVASLRGEKAEINDLLLRLIDPERGEVLPGEFLPAAERSGLMLAIDRWVIAQAIRALADPAHRQRGTGVFVRLSDGSLKDAALAKWLGEQIQQHKVGPRQLIFEINEIQADTLLRESRAFAATVKKLECGLVLSRFGSKPASAQLLHHLPLDFVKFDIALSRDLARDAARQATVKELLKALQERSVRSIAPGVEDANTMALLWQLGVDFVQGNYLQEPEVVIAGG